jgi:hypothetical protein
MVTGTGGRQTLFRLVIVSKKLSRFMVVTASPARSAPPRRRKTPHGLFDGTSREEALDASAPSIRTSPYRISILGGTD